MAQRRSSILAAVLLPVLVVVGYGVVTGLGLVWPERSTLSMVASIVVSLLAWLALGLWFKERTRWLTVICILLCAGVFVFPMIGAASLGTDLALTRDGESVEARVVDILVDQTNHREGEEAWRTTYEFEAVDDGRELGSIDYRGGKDAYGYDVGDEVDLLVDPDGEVPPKLEEKVDVGTDIAMLVLGAVLFSIVWVIGLVMPFIWRPQGDFSDL